MNEQMYVTLHQAADRLALEAARTAPASKEADCYIETYASALEFLISEHEKRFPKQSPSTPPTTPTVAP